MFTFETTALWRSSLGSDEGTELERAARAGLRSAFFGMRARAETLAGEIPRDLPALTAHDITHLDALWETASTIAGDDFPLTPAEAFVLGGAFLTHDLAMSQAAYPGGAEALARATQGRDLTAAALRRRLGRAPTAQEVESPGAEVEQQVLKDLLRLNHARQAERLPTEAWRGPSGEQYHLIETPELRQTYGQLIGRIAHSHWLSTDDLIDRFKTPYGAPGGLPPDWIVDALKVAALLRVADASHLDERRAPSFLWALRRPEGVSEEHWRFQNYLLQPFRRDDRLVYRAKKDFGVEDATAWWFCHDALRMVDGELRRVDALLADVGDRRRLAARGVARVETPERLSESVRTSGWLPVDARVRVSDVAGLARHIGGEQLYGNNRTVPLRELIQNASDAVRARRLLENRAADWGEVCVRFGRDDGGDWVEVEDNGVGMSVSVLKGALLDFGASYWDSEQVVDDLPGLLSKGFQPTGQYGIGFFSVFMWGDRVRVTSRRHAAAQSDTRVLEFGSGLSARPLLRDARPDEYRLDGGTAVRVWPRDFSIEPDGRLSRMTGWQGWRRPFRTIQDLCVALCPALDVGLYTQHAGDARELIVAANDWLSIDGSELFGRLFAWETGRVQNLEHATMVNLRPLVNSSGEILGRACLCPLSPLSIDLGAVTIGGLRANRFTDFHGVIVGRSERATRDRAIPVADLDTWAAWASEQATLVQNISRLPNFLNQGAALIRALGGDTGDLPVARGAHGWLSERDILRWADLPDELMLVNESYDRESVPDTLAANALVTRYRPVLLEWMRQAYPETALPEQPTLVYEDETGQRHVRRRSLHAAVIEALAKAWGASFEEVLKASDFSSSEYVIGKKGGQVLRDKADVIRNPRAGA